MLKQSKTVRAEPIEAHLMHKIALRQAQGEWSLLDNFYLNNAS